MVEALVVIIKITEIIIIKSINSESESGTDAEITIL